MRGIMRFLNIMLAAILAGVSFGIWIGFNPQGYSPSTYLEQQLNMLHGLRALLVVLVILSTIITLTSAFLQKSDKPVFISLLIAAGSFIACMLITKFGSKPIDDMVLTWNSTSLPGNWMELRDKWWTLHILRTIFEFVGLCIVTWTGVRKS